MKNSELRGLSLDELKSKLAVDCRHPSMFKEAVFMVLESMQADAHHMCLQTFHRVCQKLSKILKTMLQWSQKVLKPDIRPLFESSAPKDFG